MAAFSLSRGQELSWTSLSVTKHRGKKTILANVAGRAKPGQVTAILGHSGSGKTTLLKALAGRGSFSEGTIMLDGARIHPNTAHAQQQIAYVGDHDVMDQTLTCREAIAFSARLRLPKQQHNKLGTMGVVNRLIQALKLEACADTQARVLSAGERRRLSLAVELVLGPRIAILDEPTSGLDSFYGMMMMDCIRSIADSGASVLISIHHPNMSMFEKLDHVILLHHGRVMVQGAARSIPSVFEVRGHPLPDSGESPADWMLTVSQTYDVAQLEADSFFAGEEEEEDWQSASSDTDETTMSSVDSEQSIHTASAMEELKILSERDWKHTIRDREAMIPRVLLSVLGGVVFAIVYHQVADAQIDSLVDFSSHVGLLFFFFLCAAIIAPSLLVDAIQERPLFEREYRTGHYRIWTYVLVKAIREFLIYLLLASLLTGICYSAVGFQGRFWYLALSFVLFTWSFSSGATMLAAAVSDPARATDYVGLVLLPQALFCGFYIAISQLPSWLQWAQWAQPLTYAFRLALEEEFRFCGSPSERDGYLLDCMSGLAEITGFTASIADDAVYTLTQTGVYQGASALQEYLQLVSPSTKPDGTIGYEGCLVDDHSDLMIHEVSASSCSITTASILSATLSPELTLEPNSRSLASYGYHLEYAVNHERGTLVHEQHLYWANPFGDALTALLDFEKISNGICDTLENVCDDQYYHFENHTQCVDAMMSLPQDQVNVHGVHSLQGNSTGCRMVHNLLAVKSPEMHCPHISWLPQEDPNGNYKCDDRVLDKLYYNFTEEERMMYARIAAGYGIDSPTQARMYVSESREAVCEQNVVGEIMNRLAKNNEFEQLNAICYSYLQANSATSEYTAIYWSALLGVSVFLRILSGLFLYRQARRCD